MERVLEKFALTRRLTGVWDTAMEIAGFLLMMGIIIAVVFGLLVAAIGTASHFFGDRWDAEERFELNQAMHQVCEHRGVPIGSTVEVTVDGDTEIHRCPDPAAYGGFQDFDAWYESTNG